MLAHTLRDDAGADTGEKVDREPRVFRVAEREHVGIRVLHRRLIEPLGKHLEAQVRLQLREQDLDEDARRGGGVVLGHVHRLEARPADAVRGEQCAKEARNVAQPVRLVPVDGVVVVPETLLVQPGPRPAQLAEPLADVAVEFRVGTLLRAALDHHVAHLDLEARWQLHLEQLVHALLKVKRRHDRQVDRAPQVDQVRLGAVLDLDLLLCSGCLLYTSPSPRDRG